jgi:purine-nucleoside/S-methyl-5'-thioadenosine phosphorylase / adenosine deaminase
MEGAERRGGYRVWAAAGAGAEVRFVGRGPRRPLLSVLGRLGAPAGLAVAWARQVHSARVLAASEGGERGQGDALWSDRPGLALAVATADCVPVVLAGGGRVAAVHAGWRGIAAGVVGQAVAALAVEPGRLAAWIGPAIGPCCYEVGEEVAARVVAAAEPGIARPGPRGRPHLDLPAAVGSQLVAAGVGEVETLGGCTRCHPESLFSYRGEGRRAGRNLAFVWRSPKSPR